MQSHAPYVVREVGFEPTYLPLIRRTPSPTWPLPQEARAIFDMTKMSSCAVAGPRSPDLVVGNDALCQLSYYCMY